MSAYVVTFEADGTRYNVWVWPDSESAQVNTAPKSTSAWQPHLGDVTVEVQT